MTAGPGQGEIERALIVRTSHLGDIAQTIPLAHALRARWPGVRIGWVIQPEFAPLVEPLAEPLTFARDGGAGAWPRLRKEMRAFRPDLVLDAQGNWKSAFAARLAGSGRRVGFPSCDWQEPLAARILRIGEAAPGAQPTAHLVDRVRTMAAAVCGSDFTFRRDPGLDEDEIATGGRALRAARERTARPDLRPVILHPGVPGDPRTWPADRFAELARTLSDVGACAPIILTGPGEVATGERLRSELSGKQGVGHIVGQRGLRQLAALLFAAAKAGGAMVSSDSGPAHMAASVDLPVHLLAGPEDPSATGPWPIASTPDSPHQLVAPPVDWNAIAGGKHGWVPRDIESVGVRCAATSVQ